MKGSVAMLNLRIEDKNPHLKDELHAIMEENKDVFQSVLAGEDKYVDSLGWFSVEKWANREEVQKKYRSYRSWRNIFERMQMFL